MTHKHHWVLHWALKQRFSLETKGLWGWKIDWLMWRLTKMVIRHYMHMVKMKKHKFLENKVVEHIVKANVEKVALICYTHVTHGTNNLNEIGCTWMEQKPMMSKCDIQGPTSTNRKWPFCNWSMWLIFCCKRHLWLKSQYSHWTSHIDTSHKWQQTLDEKKINKICLHPLTSHICIVTCN